VINHGIWGFQCLEPSFFSGASYDTPKGHDWTLCGQSQILDTTDPKNEHSNFLTWISSISNLEDPLPISILISSINVGCLMFGFTSAAEAVGQSTALAWDNWSLDSDRVQKVDVFILKLVWCNFRSIVWNQTNDVLSLVGELRFKSATRTAIKVWAMLTFLSHVCVCLYCLFYNRMYVRTYCMQSLCIYIFKKYIQTYIVNEYVWADMVSPLFCVFLLNKTLQFLKNAVNHKIFVL